MFYNIVDDRHKFNIIHYEAINVYFLDAVADFSNFAIELVIIFIS